MTKSPQTIEIHNLSFSYERGYPILSDCHLSIAKGSFVGIIGPNGGGKTTFLKLLMGFLNPLHGTISLFGTPPKQAHSLISYVPQSHSLDKEFPISVLEFVLMGRLNHLNLLGNFCSHSKAKAEALLDKLGLLALKNAHFGSLSGGQAQRATIARALVSDPEILILDEPTANVDSKAEKEILSLLSSLKGTMTIIMVSHDLQATLNHVDKILCIQKTITEMAPEEVCHHFALGLYHPIQLKPKG